MSETRSERIVISITPAQKRAIERYVEDYYADSSTIVTAASLGRHLLLQKAAPYLDKKKRSMGPAPIAPDGVPVGAEVRFGEVQADFPKRAIGMPPRATPRALDRGIS